eukprot:2846265-Prymnesium_polylepis.1
MAANTSSRSSRSSSEASQRTSPAPWESAVTAAKTTSLSALNSSASPPRSCGLSSTVRIASSLSILCSSARVMDEDRASVAHPLECLGSGVVRVSRTHCVSHLGAPN